MSQFSNDKTYMSICSERTLQSNSKGFFLTFADHVAENAGEKWIKNVFGKLKTDKQRIRIIYEYEPTRNVLEGVFLNVQEIYRKKSAEVSMARRMEAEESLRGGDGKKALMLYSQSVLRAPEKEATSLALALWGRSQALIVLQKYTLALRDIQQALKSELPTVFKPVAYWKMAICYKARKETEKSKVAFALAEKLLQDPNKILELLEDKNKIFVEEMDQDSNNSRRVEPLISGGLHEVFNSASKKISVKQSKDLGRYAVAKENIKTGDTLVVEEPYAACLLPEMFGTNCHHCFDRLVAPLGCPDCSSVAFCSPECQNLALGSYHKYECKFLDLLIGSGMSILGHTALRMVTHHTLSRILEISKERTKERVYGLCTNANLRPAGDFLQRTLMAGFLLRCLQKSGYFPSTEHGERDSLVSPSEDEFRVGELLLFHLQMLQFNAHEIYETRHTPEHRFQGAKAAYIGVAVYPTVALFNHDCHPAVTRYFVGKKIVIKAVRPLAPQEIISENYGPIFTRKSLQERQRSLSARYWFTCQCVACCFNWPSIGEGLENATKRLRCPNSKCNHFFTLPVSKDPLQCPQCKTQVALAENIQKLKWCESQYQLGFEAMDAENPEIAIVILCEALEIFYRISSPPHKATHLAQETLRACLADSGNVSASLVRKNK